MNKKIISFLFAVLLTIPLFAACVPNKVSDELPQSGTGTYADYIDSGKRIAAEAGDVYYGVAKDLFKAKEATEYASTAHALESVRMGKADAMLLSHGYIKQLEDSGAYPDFEYLWVPTDVYVNEAAPIFYTEELRDKYNDWLQAIKDDGTWQEIIDRWIGVPLPAQEDIPKFELTGENGTLKMCDTGNYPPLSYFDANGELTGLNSEIMSRFAQHLGMKMEITMMSYEAIAPYVASGKADMSACTLTITDERKENIIMGAPTIITQAVLVVPKKGKTEPGYTNFVGKRIGVVTGAAWDQLTKDTLGSIPVYYSEMSAAIEDIRRDRLDGYVADLSGARVFTSLADNYDLQFVEIPSEIFAAPMGAISNNQDIVDRFNIFLDEVKSDGTLDEMKHRWLENIPDIDSPMPDIELTGENGTLKVATTAGALPFAYMGADNKLKGYSIELALRFAAHEGMEAEFAEMEFGGMIPYVVSGKADLAIADISITEERKKSVLFTDSIYDDQGGIVVLKQDSPSFHTDFLGKKFAVMTGSVFDEIADRVFSAGEKLYFNNVIDEIQAVHKGKADAALLDHVVAMVNLSGGEYSDLTTTEVPLEELNFKYAVFSDKQEIIDKYNQFLKEIKDSGIYDDMEKRWFTDYDNTRTIPEIPLTGKNGTLRIAINAAYPPFVYLGDSGKWSGFDIEQFYRFAEYLDMDIEFADMEFGAMLPYVISGKCDIASSIYYTDERAKSVIFGDVDYVGKTVLVHKKDTVVEKVSGKGFINWVKTGIERNLVTDNRWRMILSGLGVTMIISIAAQIFGTVFGCLVCFVLMRKNKFARQIGEFYCGLIHGTPIVVLLMITYYIIFGNTDISSVLVAIAAFTLVEGAIVAQNLKGAIDTVDPVEIEAARSIGFSAFRAFMTVTMPQAVRRALPSYTSSFVELVKSTAIVGYIAIQDLTRAGDIIRSRTYDAYFPLLFVALIYLTVTTFCVQLFKFIIKKINGGVV